MKADDLKGAAANAHPLEICLLAAAREFGAPISLSTLRSYQTGTTELTIDGLVDLAERIGFLIGLGEYDYSKLDQDLLPAMLMGPGGRAVLLLKRHGNQFSVLDPLYSADEVGLISLDDLKKTFDNKVLLIRKKDLDNGASRVTRSKGHWFWSTLARNKWAYTQVLIAAAVSNVLGLATSIFIMVVYDRVLPNEAIESLLALTFGVGIALVFDFILRSLRAAFIDRAGQKADLIMGRIIFDRMLDLQLAAKRGSTGAIANIMREFETLRDFITSATLVGVIDLPFIVLFVFVISLIGGPLAIVPMIAVPIVLLVGVVVQPTLMRLADKSQAEGQTKQSVLVETLSGLETIKTLGAGHVMRDRWDTALKEQSTSSSSSRAAAQFAMNATAFTQQAAQVMIVFYGVFLITQGTVSMGALIACVILTGRTLAPLAQLAQIMTRFSQARASFRSVTKLMNQPVEHPDDRRWLARPFFFGRIEFRNVTFRYPDQKSPILSNVSFEILPGEKVAILGKVGSGKSTIGRLLCGLYSADSGQVLIDDTDITHIARHDLRENIGSLLQDVWLFSGTVRDNIAVGKQSATDLEVLGASKLTGVHDFVSKHPLGYDLQLSERGAELSGGQRQAIGLARAIIGQKPILFLDEPTSAMDVHSEQALISGLTKLDANTTFLLVTHRTSLLDTVDRVIILDAGKVIADGPKENVLQRALKTRNQREPAVDVDR